MGAVPLDPTMGLTAVVVCLSATAFVAVDSAQSIGHACEGEDTVTTTEYWECNWDCRKGRAWVSRWRIFWWGVHAWRFIRWRFKAWRFIRRRFKAWRFRKLARTVVRALRGGNVRVEEPQPPGPAALRV